MKNECYAKCLGGCNMISKEHYFSHAILKEYFHGVFEVEWFSFRKTHADGFFSKILCRRHNNQLKRLDSEATRLFRLYRSISLNKPLKSNHIINGKLIERWMLKVYLGLYAAGQLSISIDEPTHQKLVNVLFGQEEWNSGAGMHTVFPSLNSSIEIDCSLGLSILNQTCFVIRLCNLHYAITTHPCEIESVIQSINMQHAVFHPIGGEFKQEAGRSIHVNFTWN